MSKFQKLSQINKDIELLEDAGKIKAAEVLHQKFIKESQVVTPYQATPSPVRERTVYRGEGNYFEKGDDFARSVRNNEGTLYNFKGLQPEMEPVRVQTSPGNYTTVLRPKGNIGNPYQTRQNDPNANIPGYNEFLRLKPNATEIREFIESKGLTSPTGQAIFNAKQNGTSNPVSPTTDVNVSKSLGATSPQVQPVAENPNAGPIAPNPITINTMPSARNVQPTSAPMPTAPVRTNQPQISSNSPATTQAQPVAQDNFQNFYTEQSDTANFYQQQNSMSNPVQQENQLYQKSINQIAGLLNTKNPINRTMAQQIYENTIVQFKDPKRKQAFGNQFQQIVSRNFPGQSLKPTS
jgi:hypothetical protein